jgi:hypothetical protein
MSRNPAEGDGRKRPRWAVIGAVVTAFLVSVAGAIGAGLGSRVLDQFDSDQEPPPSPPAKVLTSSATELIPPCSGGLFLPADAARRAVSETPPTAADWGAFRTAHGAVPVAQSVVEVSVQGETARKVTLTSTAFEVERRPRRPRGAVFQNTCGGFEPGRELVIDLDADPVAIVSSTEDPEGAAGAYDPSTGELIYKPIRFPWTVSVTDPLVLKVTARTERCYCNWRGRIVWRSGDKSGAIPIDNGGRGYDVIASPSSAVYANRRESGQGWVRSDP